jgi:hypothetical protein
VVWGADLLVTATALTLVAMIGAGGTMWVYAAIDVLAFVVIRHWSLRPPTIAWKKSKARCARIGSARPAG